MHLLAKKPADRPASAQPVADILERIAREQAAPHRRRVPAGKPGGRRRWRIGATVAAGVLVLGLIGLWAGSVLKGKPKDGSLVAVNEPNPKAFVDGGQATVPRGDAGKQDEFPVNPVKLPASPPSETTPPQGAPAPSADGFVPLFNGKDLAGWHVEGGHARNWTVEEGAIVGRSPHWRARSYLLSDQEYTDFVLRLEFMIDHGGTGGVGLRAIDGERVPMPNGNFIPGHPLIGLPEGANAWLKEDKSSRKQTEDLQLPTGAWHALEITMRGTSCIVHVPGKPVIDIHGNPTRHGTIVPGLQRTKGRIGLFARTGTSRYRGVQIKELAP
jgi:hypothetical protein